MILLIDNYDSFAHNLARYCRRLHDRVVVYRNDAITVEDVLEIAPDLIVLSPGPKRPEDAGISLQLVQTAAARIPIFGVCLGHQTIAAAFGAEVRRSAPCHGRASLVYHDRPPLFDGLPSPFPAARYHSLAVDASSLPSELRVTATTEDGTVMAVEHTAHPIAGVQFHPESILTPHGYRLLANVLRWAGLETSHPVPSFDEECAPAATPEQHERHKRSGDKDHDELPAVAMPMTPYRVIEGIVGTLGPDGTPHFAPMGPRVPTTSWDTWSAITLRPFPDSQTLANLRRTGKGVFHVIDDALLLARALTGADLSSECRVRKGGFPVLNGAVAWLAFKVVSFHEEEPRVRLECRIVDRGSGGSWSGWNRAQHAIVELAILVSRAHLLPAETIREQLEPLRSWVSKTGGPRERQAWEMLRRKLEEHVGQAF